MRILKILYIIWIVLWAIGFAIFTPIVHNLNFSVFLEILFGFVLLCLFPLLPYLYYLIYEKANSTKNIFVAIWLKENNNNASFYSIGIIIHIVTFVMIYKSKRSSNEASNQQP